MGTVVGVCAMGTIVVLCVFLLSRYNIPATIDTIYAATYVIYKPKIRYHNIIYSSLMILAS
jgi:hypothetical protein